MPEYWVYTWLDSHRIRTLDDARSQLAETGVLEDLKVNADLVIENWLASEPTARPSSLIAGAGIDLSGRLDCNATSCRRAQVDRLFRRAWHYFETIVARDAIAEDLRVHRSCPDEEVIERLLPQFETVLMVREYGAEPLVEFAPRKPACFEHWRQHAKEAGMEDIALREEVMVDQLFSETDINLSKKKDGVLCTLDNRDFSHRQWIDLTKSEIRGKSEKSIKRAALRRVVRKFLVHLSADVNAAKKYGGAFGSSIPVFQRLLGNRGENIAKVALEVELPVLDGLSAAQLIDVRLEYADSFSRFRKRIQSFLEACIRQGVREPVEIREKMKADLIEGELQELKSNLRVAEESLKRKSAYALSLATLVTTIGVATGIVTPAVAFGLAATVSATSLSPGAARYVDDIAKLKSDDMYFLLEAEAHRH